MIFLIISSCHRIEKNNRTDINKPNEDYIICDDKLGLYLIADGVTRPHNEYQNDSQDSLASKAAILFCQKVKETISENLSDFTETNVCDKLKQILINANDELSDSYANSIFPPSISVLLCFVFNDKIYFYNNCDTIGLILRHGAKIQFTTKYNYKVKKEKKYSKNEIYQLLYNGDSEDSYPMINGDPRFNENVFVSFINLEIGDKIILSSDGLYEFLLSTKYSILYDDNIDNYFIRSLEYDIFPFGNYADDKSCIVIEVN